MYKNFFVKLILQAFRESALRDLWINIKLILYLLRSQNISFAISLYYLFLLAISFFSTIENKVIKKNKSLFPLNFNREPVKKKNKKKTLRFLSSMKCGNSECTTFINSQREALINRSLLKIFCNYSTQSCWPPMILRKIPYRNLLETLRRLCLSSKFPHQEIRWNYYILCSVNFKSITTASCMFNKVASL